MPTSRTLANGFTLIEILVALSVLALGIAGTAKLTQLGYSQLAAAENYRRATHLAHSHLNTISVGAAPQRMNQQGSYDERFRWELLFTPLKAEDIVPRIGAAALQTEMAAQLAVPELTKTTKAMRVDLTVLFEEDARRLNFHSLLLFRTQQ